MKLSEAMGDYWLAKELTMAETTMPGYQRTFRRFVEYVGDVEIAAVTSADVRRFLLHLRNDMRLGKRTVSDAWVPLSSLWTWAESELGLPHILRGKVARPAFTKKIIEPFTQEDMRRLLAIVWTDAQGAERRTAYRDRALILTLLDSGARVSELCAFTVGDYDATNGRLHIRHGKGDKARFVVVGTRTQKAIAKWLESWGGAQNHAPLFPSKATGGALRRDAVKHLLARLARRAGVANVHPHRFRHTFAINFLRNGGSVLMLQALLGHTDLSMSKRYVALAELDIDGARKQSPVDGWEL
jgi:integrase/recombinase XerD